MSKQVFAFLKQSLTCKFNENLWPFQRANKKLWNLSTALSFKTDANSQRSCYFIARILMFFSLSHDFSMPLSKSRSTSRMEVNSILSRLCANASGKSSGWLRTANPEYSFPPAEDLCPMIPSPIALTRSVAMTEDACPEEVLMFFLTPKSLVRRYENTCLIQSRKNQSPQTSNSEIWELELSLFQQKLSVKDRKSRNNTILSNRGDWLQLRL